MVPKVEIRYSWIYNKQLNRDFTKQDLFDLREKCKKFEKLYNKYIRTILIILLIVYNSAIITEVNVAVSRFINIPLIKLFSGVGVGVKDCFRISSKIAS